MVTVASTTIRLSSTMTHRSWRNVRCSDAAGHDLQRGVDEHAQAQHPDDDRGVGSRGDVGDHRGEGERHGVDAHPSDKAERSCRRGHVGEPARPADQTLDDPEVVNRQQDEEHTERDRVGAELVWRQQPGEHQPEAELAGPSEELGDQAPPQRRARGGTTATGRIWSPIVRTRSRVGDNDLATLSRGRRRSFDATFRCGWAADRWHR